MKIKDIVNEILQEFQFEQHVVFRDQEQARDLILKAYIRGKKDESGIKNKIRLCGCGNPAATNSKLCHDCVATRKSYV